MLDIDHGTYPFVTSSSAGAGGAVIGTGVPPNAIQTVVGVTKAYCTRVGSGPFPTEVNGAVADELRARGNEYGAVTGRPRRCGWVDLVVLRYAQMINGVNWWVVTKLDVLDQLDEIPVCIGYKVDGKKTDSIPALATGFETVECIFEKLPGWKTSTEGITSFSKLPKKAQHYLQFLEKESGARIGMVSTGPEREQTIFMPDFEAELIGSPEKIARAK
jgi:adenylosuccinate synthase